MVIIHHVERRRIQFVEQIVICNGYFMTYFGTFRPYESIDPHHPKWIFEMTDFSNLLARENRVGGIVNVLTIQRRISYFVATPPTKLIGCLKSERLTVKLSNATYHSYFTHALTILYIGIYNI